MTPRRLALAACCLVTAVLAMLMPLPAAPPRPEAVAFSAAAPAAATRLLGQPTVSETHMFRHRNIGPLVGKRTWGANVGAATPGRRPPLTDRNR